MLTKTTARFALLATFGVSVLLAASDSISIYVRDARTHYAVRATVRLEGPDAATLRTDATGHLYHMVLAGKYGVWYGVEVSAPGYQMTTSRILPGLSPPLRIMLVPERAEEEERPAEVARHLRAGYSLLHGYAVDVETGQPISGVRIRVKAMAETLTDARGYYWLAVPKTRSPQPQASGAVMAIAEKDGYETVISKELSVAGEEMQGPIFDMKKGRPWAILGYTAETARSALQAGVDPNLKGNRGWTALKAACSMKNIGMVRVLTEAGADVNIEDDRGRTPLMDASFLNYTDIVEVLVQAGAKVNQRDRDGITALMIARWLCHSQVAEILTRAGAAAGPGEWRRAPRFEDFPVSSIYKGVPAPVDLRSHREASMFRTRLREGSRKGPNFAGHYTVVSWGCGSNCESNMIIDTPTGRIYDGFADERGAKFKINSRLVIADPGNSGSSANAGNNPTESLPVRYYEWTDHKLKLIYEEACSVINGYQKCGCEASKPLPRGSGSVSCCKRELTFPSRAPARGDLSVVPESS